jgi:hypothetical protein
MEALQAIIDTIGLLNTICLGVVLLGLALVIFES